MSDQHRQGIDDFLRGHRVTVSGDHGPFLVLLHGFASDLDVWSAVLPGLTDRFRVVRYDLAGSGPHAAETFDPLRHSHLEAHVDDLLRVLDLLDIQQCIFIGASLGGMIGVLAAIERPSSFRQLILMGASSRYLDDGRYVGGFDQPSLDALYDAMSADYDGWLTHFAPLVVQAPAASPPVQLVERNLRTIGPDIAMTMARTIFQSDFRGSLPRLKVETVVLQMRNDPAVPLPAGRYVSEAITGSTYELLEADGHFPHISAPKVVSEALRRHLEPWG